MNLYQKSLDQNFFLDLLSFTSLKVIIAKISNNRKKNGMNWFSVEISTFLIYLYFGKKIIR
tara:strand:- start:611 stop:793 length:183 start_codon:yes stop_codon:yes gene_type:complete